MALKIRTIAEKLGLSPATISLALNNRPGVSPTTREKVLQAVREMGGADLIQSAGGKGSLLFLVYHKRITHDGSSYFSQLFADIIHGAETQARRLGYNLLVTYADRASLREQVERIDPHAVQGVLLLATDLKEEQMDCFAGLTLPLVVIDNYWPHRALDCVTINNAQGVYKAIEYLLSMGHREIGYLHVLGDANNFIERHEAYFQALRHYGLAVREDWVYGINTKLGGEEVYQEMVRLLEARPQLPTAFFADNDIVVVYVLRVLRQLGLQVPGDVSIVGFDNMPLTEILDPPLTTVHPDRHRIGVLSVDALISKMQADGGMDSTVKIVVGTQLALRDSVAAPRGL